MQVSCGPIARCTSAAATAESTPPLSAQITRLGADLRAHRGDLLVDDRAHRPRRRAPRQVVHEPLAAPPGRTACGPPRGGTARPRSAATGSSSAATGASGVLTPSATKPARRLGDGVEVAHPHVLLVGHDSSSSVDAEPAMRVSCGPAVLAAHAAADGAAELLGDQLRAVADAEDRDAELVDRRVERSARPRRARSSARPTGSARPARRSATSAAVIRCGTISE